ncbi:hypothetical protein DSO57_1022618 [Entomophthora muscae]|uniref:Uncharacterized protein n=1 Tax=Entomophthora muscae TaxID=34485 RepID=A0ACC2S581_9FUNG|nr:hypothetical protein DSO57_1022618 [Entomophthora muscae]
MKFTLLVSIVVAAPYSTKPVEGKHSVVVNLKPFEKILYAGNIKLLNAERLNYNSIIKDSHVDSKDMVISKGEEIRKATQEKLEAKAKKLQEVKEGPSAGPEALSVPVRSRRCHLLNRPIQ